MAEVDGVTKRYELTATWDVINDIVTSNLTDPLTGDEARSATGEWIKNGFPNPSKLGQVGGWRFPLIVIRIPDIETEQATLLCGANSKDRITHNVEIECHARTRLQAAQLAEEIMYILKVTGQSEFKVGCLHGPNVLGTSEDVDFIGANKYYTKTVEYEFKRFD